MLDLDLVERAVAEGGVCLVRVAPPHVHRVYWYLVQDNLLGGVDLVRVWGRHGCQQHRPRQRVEAYGNLEGLETALRSHLRRRLRRGYVARERPRSEVRRAVAA